MRQAEEAEELLVLGSEFGLEGLHEGGFAVELVAGEGAEGLQDSFGGGRFAVAELGVDLDSCQGCSGHGCADLAFDEGADEQREEPAAEQGLDPGWAVQ